MKTKLQFNIILLALPIFIIGWLNSFSQINWEKYANNPVITGISGNWNYSVYSPAVLFEESTFKMWFLAYNSGNYNVGYAESVDGINWIMEEDPVISSGQSGEWDRWKSPRTMLRINDTLKMWFHASPNFNDNFSIGYAWSVEEHVWNFNPEPVLENGQAGSWDESLIYNPSVYFDGELYHMWYSGSMNNATYDQVGYAFSNDGINWTKDNENNPVIELGDGTFYNTWVQAGPVIVLEGIYHMWFGGYDGNLFKVGYATSPDTINWTVQNYMLPVVDVGLTGNWDDVAIHQPAVLIHDGIFKMWYGGWGDVHQIGYAVGDSVTITNLSEQSDIILDILKVYPCPLTNSATISYQLSDSTPVTLEIYNINGQCVSTLVNEVMKQGNHEVLFDSNKLKAGIYFCILKTNEGIQTRKIIKLN